MVKTKHSQFMIALKFNSLFVNVFTFTSGFALRQFFLQSERTNNKTAFSFPFDFIRFFRDTLTPFRTKVLFEWPRTSPITFPLRTVIQKCSENFKERIA